ncbi:MAG: phage terminase large subunit [Nanoarchaeota archaeon]|nr:phage terminase large subunit [Nanoarchaeota archaeon]
MQSSAPAFKPTQALYKIAALRKPIRAIEGSQGAGKTIAILMLLINHAQHNRNKSITVFQYERSKMKKTVVRDFIKIMQSLGFYVGVEWNKTESVYTFPTGSYIEFLGLDEADVGKGFRRDIIYFNELNRGRITLDTFVQLQSRCTITYADYNPDERFWLHTDILKNDNVDFIRVTYLDNEYIPKGELKAILDYRAKGFHDPNGSLTDEANIKSSYWANKWIVYGLGMPGKMDGTIYSDWEVIDSIPPEAKLIGAGLDFGYSQDPTAVVIVYKYNDDIVVDEVLFRKGLGISEIANSLKGLKTGTIYCDSADPRSIAELKRYGIPAVGVRKGRGSVIAGVELLQSKHMLITKRSVNLIKALGHYSWSTDREGNKLNKPNHLWSDILDALRYLAISKLRHSNEATTYAIL